MASIETNEPATGGRQKKAGFFSKFIFLGVIPFLYTIGLAMAILNFAGIKFDTQVKWIENHTKMFLPVKAAKAKAPLEKVADTTGKKGQTTKILATKTEAQTVQPAKKVSSPPTNQNDVQTSSSNESNSTAVPTVSSFENMDPSSAAKLLSNMSEAEALKNLKTLSPNTQSEIIAEMPADIGARLTDALASGKEPDTSTSSSVQLYQYMKPEQIAAILNAIKDNQEVLRQIKQLDPDTASKVLAQMNPQVASWVVTHLN